MNCAKCKNTMIKVKYTCDILCEKININEMRKIKQVELCLNCFKEMIKDENKFMKEFYLDKENILKEHEMM